MRGILLEVRFWVLTALPASCVRGLNVPRLLSVRSELGAPHELRATFSVLGGEVSTPYW